MEREADQLVVGHIRLARSLARRFTGRGETLEDLEGVAQLALVGAAKRFDPDRKVSFATFATVSVLGELKRHMRDRAWCVRPPRRVHDLVLEIGNAREVLSHQLGRSPGIPDLAAHLGRTNEDVLEAMEASGGYGSTSLSARTGEDDRTLLDVLGVDDPNFTARLDKLQLQHALAILPRHDRRLLNWYFIDERTQLDIAGELGCSQMQISRRLNQILTRLRRHLVPA